MFNTINRKFYGILGLLLLMFCIAYGEVAFFLNKQNQVASQGRDIIRIERKIRTLVSDFYEMRFWAGAVFTQKFSDAEQKFGTLLSRMKAQISDLENEPFASPRKSQLDLTLQLLGQYEQSFNELIQINTEQRLQATRLDSSYQSLASSILSIRDTSLLKPLFVLTQFQMNYRDNHRQSEYKALQVVIQSLRAKLLQAKVLDKRIQSYLSGYSRILDKDVQLDRDFSSTNKAFDQISHELTLLFSEITREAEILLHKEFASSDQLGKSLNYSFLMSMGLSLIVIITVTFFVARKIAQPIRAVTMVINDIKAGRMESRYYSETSQKDEISQLGLAFNEMLDNLDSNNKQLFKYQLELESKIQELALREQESESLIDELESKNTELEMFTYTVSHDLKSPLITIQGFLGFLEKDVVSGNVERMQADCSRIKNAVNKMQQLLDDLLELSRIGRIINAPKQINFEDLAREAAKTVAGRLNEKDIHTTIASNMPMLNVDHQRMREALENLLDNAAKYMGSQVAPQIDIGYRRSENRNIFFIKDNGMGIDPKYHDKIFGLFETLEHSKNSTGVGLAIVKRIIEVHGGKIWVESDGTGSGSTFCFTLAETRILN